MSASYLASAEEDLSCPLCLELFVDPNTPKQLSCAHVYCQICLVEMVEGGLCAVTCPECRAITTVPPKTPTSDGGIVEMKTSIRLRSLAEKYLKHTEKHNVLPSEKQAKPSSVPTCPEHDEEKMHFYCVTCKVLACQACVLLDHDKTMHEIKGVKIVYKEKLAEMKKRMKSADDSLKRQTRLESVMKQEKKVEATMAATEHEINKAVAELLVKVKEQGERAIEQTKELNQGKLQRYQKQMKKLQHDIQSVRTTKAEIKSIMENASPYEYLRKHSFLEEKIKKMQIDEPVEKMENFEEATASKWIQVPIEQLGMWVRVRELKQIQKIEGPKNIMNAGGMKGTLAICQLNCVSIYRKQQAGKYKHELNVNVAKGDGFPRGVAVTANGKILVILKNSVRVYRASGQHESTFHTTKDKNTKDVELASITTLADGRVVIGDEGRRVLTVHTPVGELVNTIKLGFSPYIITAMKGAQVAMCIGFWKVYVYDVDTDTEVLSVDVEGRLRCVCYDEETDCLLVGNHYGEIEQYCVSPWELVTTNRAVTGYQYVWIVGLTNIVVKEYPQDMIFADKDDLVLYSNTGYNLPTDIYVYRCVG